MYHTSPINKVHHIEMGRIKNCMRITNLQFVIKKVMNKLSIGASIMDI